MKHILSILILALTFSFTACNPSGSGTDDVNTLPPLGKAAFSLAIDRVGIYTLSDDLIVGTTVQLEAIATFYDGTQKNVTEDVIWKVSGDANTISVDSKGLVTILKKGNAKVSAYHEDNNKEIISNILSGDIVEATVNSISITGDTVSVVGVPIQVNSFASFNNGQTLNITNVTTWESNNTKVTVSNGKIESSEANSTALITATFDAKSTTHTVNFVDAIFDHIEIQENGGSACQGDKINDKLITIELVSKVSYPNDPDGLSPNAHYPIACAVYTDGRKEYINQEADWDSEDQSAAYVNDIRGSFVFGRDLNPKVKISATWGGKTAQYFVNVVAQSGKVLDQIVIKNGWNKNLPDIVDANVTEGQRTPFVAYGWFTTNGVKTLEYINTNVSWSSSDLETAWIEDAFSSYVYGVKPGNATITAKWQGREANVNMTVLADSSPTLSSISFEKGCGATQNGETIDDENPLLLGVGQEQCINAWGKYSDNSIKRLTTTVLWTANDDSIASMDIFQSSSKVTGEALGETFVTATQDGVSANASVAVVDPSKVYLDGVDEAPVGSKQQLKAIIISSGKPYYVNDKVNWTSSDESIATVNEEGIMSAVAEGNVTFTATVKDDASIKATHSMKVVSAVLESIQIEKSYNPSVPQPISTLDVELGTKEYITTWAIYSDGSRRYVNTDTVYWSSDQQKASINYLDSSKVYGRDLGNDITISAYYGGKEASILVNVINSGPTLLSIIIKDGWGNSNEVNGTTISLEVDNKQALVAYGVYDDNTTRDINAKVAWDSSDYNVSAIFDVFSSYVYGISVGSADINATWQGVSATVTTNVVASTVPTLDSIEIQKGYQVDGNGEVIDVNNSLVLKVGETQYITAWGIYSNGEKRYVNRDAYWESNDQTIASMSLLQLDSKVTGESEGNTTLRASYDGKVGTAAVKVVSSPAKIITANILNDVDANRTLSADGFSVTGTADSAPVYYYQDNGNGYKVGQKLSEISFEFAATGAPGFTTYVNVYVLDEKGNKVRILIGEDDPTANSYLTWADLPSSFANYTIRRYWEWNGLDLVEGNFFLRTAASGYSGTDAYSITKFEVTTK